MGTEIIDRIDHDTEFGKASCVFGSDIVEPVDCVVGIEDYEDVGGVVLWVVPSSACGG